MIKSEVNEGRCSVQLSGTGKNILIEFSNIVRNMFETFPESMVKHEMLLGETMADKGKIEKHMPSEANDMETALSKLAEELKKMEEE